MDYNNEENNRYPQNQNGYQNNVPKPTFSGVMGKDKSSDVQFQNGNMYNNQSQFGFPNYQTPNGYQHNPMNYTNSYNNYQNPNNNGMIYYPQVSYQPNDQLTNNMYASQFQNPQQAWPYSETDNRLLYQNNTADNPPINDVDNKSYNGYESGQNKRQMISYEDVVPSSQVHNKKQKKQKKQTHQKQVISMDYGTPEKEGRPIIQVESNRNESDNGKKNKDKEEEVPKPTKEILIQKKFFKIEAKEKEVAEIHKPEVKNEINDEDDEYDEENDNKNGVNIQGTSIKLDTDEDIAKWKAERRKMWLLKISNKKEEHMKAMGIKEVDLKNTSVLNEAKKQKRFIQSIESQVHRYDPNANLNIKVVQRGMSVENDKILQFVQELGDVGLLTYELTDEEKDKLFGGMNNNNNNNGRKSFRNNKPYGNAQKKRFDSNRRYKNNKR